MIAMNVLKRQLLRQVGLRSAARAAALSRLYIRARPHDREAIMAGIRFEKWMTDVCEFCLD